MASLFLRWADSENSQGFVELALSRLLTLYSKPPLTKTPNIHDHYRYFSYTFTFFIYLLQAFVITIGIFFFIYLFASYILLLNFLIII